MIDYYKMMSFVFYYLSLFFLFFVFFFSSRRRHTRSLCDWSSDVCSSDLSLPHKGGGNVVALIVATPTEYMRLAEKKLERAQRASVSFDEIGRASCRERV